LDVGRMNMPPHEVTLDIVGAMPGLTLHLQPFGDFNLEGTLDRICEAPCTHTLMTGRYGVSVSQEEGLPQPAGRLDLDANSRIQLSYYEPGNTPRDWAIGSTVMLVFGVAGVILGGWAFTQSDISTGLGGIIAGGFGVIFGGTGLAISLGDGTTAHRAGVQVVPAR